MKVPVAWLQAVEPEYREVITGPVAIAVICCLPLKACCVARVGVAASVDTHTHHAHTHHNEKSLSFDVEQLLAGVMSIAHNPLLCRPAD